MSAEPTARPRGRVQLVLLATLFFLPLLASYAMYFWFPDMRPVGTTNFGELVDPARPVPSLALLETSGQSRDETLLKGRWTYLVRSGTDCDDACERALIMTRQVRQGLNEKRSRVQRVLLAPDAESAQRLEQRMREQHPDLHIVSEDGERELEAFFDVNPVSTYLLDPLGNWLMWYPPLHDTAQGTRDDFQGIRKDIKKLLRISQIG